MNMNEWVEDDCCSISLSHGRRRRRRRPKKNKQEPSFFVVSVSTQDWLERNMRDRVRDSPGGLLGRDYLEGLTAYSTW